MATLSERLKAATVGTPDFGFASLLTTIDIVKATAVCAAVEAFQAAEQALREALNRCPNIQTCSVDEHEQWRKGLEPLYAATNAAKARLLEVNLG